jgi:hypothetical protein
VGLGERLRETAESATWPRFIRLFLGINAVLAGLLGALFLNPPDWLTACIAVLLILICVLGGLTMFAWAVYRLVTRR